MSKSSDSKNALVVIGDSSLSLAKPVLKAFQSRTVDALELIARTERDNVQRRILAGVALLIVKEQLPHGEFMPWLKKHVSGSGYTQCTYFMRAAVFFLEESKLATSDILALSDNAATLQLGKKAQETKLVAAAKTFVGDKTWTELLEDYGIREPAKLGGARTAGSKDEAEAPDAEQLYLFSRDEIGGVITRAEALLLNENRLQHLVGHPEEIRGVVESLRSLADKVEAAAKPLLGK